MTNQHYDADKVNVFNTGESDMNGLNWRSFFLGMLLALNTVLVVLVLIMFIKMNDQETKVEEKINQSRLEILHLLRKN